jgi:ribosomal protein L37AE/L43A
MEGVAWLYLASIVVFFALGALLVSARRRRLAVILKPDRCSNCETPMSLRRVSIFESPTLRGMWICPHCGARMTKPGRRTRTAT